MSAVSSQSPSPPPRVTLLSRDGSKERENREDTYPRLVHCHGGGGGVGGEREEKSEVSWSC